MSTADAGQLIELLFDDAVFDLFNSNLSGGTIDLDAESKQAFEIKLIEMILIETDAAKLQRLNAVADMFGI
jgi:hypothetical protein